MGVVLQASSPFGGTCPYGMFLNGLSVEVRNVQAGTHCVVKRDSFNTLDTAACGLLFLVHI